jgi:hypothetical protein
MGHLARAVSETLAQEINISFISFIRIHSFIHSVQIFRCVTLVSLVAKTAIALQTVLKSISRIQTFDPMIGSVLDVAMSIMHVVLFAMSVAPPSPLLPAQRSASALAVDFARMPTFNTENTIRKMTNSMTLVGPRRPFVVELSPPPTSSARSRAIIRLLLLIHHHHHHLLTMTMMTTTMANMMLGAVTAKAP